MSTTNFGRGHAALQAQEATIRGSGDGYRLRSRSVDASAKVGNRRPTPVRYPKGQESTLDTEIELRNVTLAKTTNLTQDGTENLTLKCVRSRLPVTTSANENLTLIILSTRIGTWDVSRELVIAVVPYVSHGLAGSSVSRIRWKISSLFYAVLYRPSTVVYCCILFCPLTV